MVSRIFEEIAFPESIEVDIDVEPALKVEADPILLKRILSNLVINAIQAMRKGGKLTFSACSHDSSVLILVEDTGIGISEDIKSKLFKPLVTSKSQGQGFGLVVAKRFVESMKGSIGFESQEGKGTKFTIELPLRHNK